MLKIKFSNREIALLALFSSLWAFVEINLGLVLKMFRVPFSGALLTFLGLIVIFVGRNAVPKRGTVILMGLTTAFLKMIYLGGIAIYPIIGIIIESVLVEIGLYKGRPTKFHFGLAGNLAMSWTFFHPFFTQGLLAGWGILKVYLLIVERGAQFFGIQGHQSTFIIFSIVLFLHGIFGIIAGLVGANFSTVIYRRSYIYRVDEVLERF